VTVSQGLELVQEMNHKVELAQEFVGRRGGMFAAGGAA
jgi:hypothetical protein